jgi:hypothetical protein
MIIFLTIVWFLFAYVFVRTLYVEAKQTSWDLLEALIAANILGNVVAIPIAWAWNEHDTFNSDNRMNAIVGAGLCGLVVASCMAGGAIWTFRRLKMLGETRRWPRIGYMILGLLLFPSMVSFPYSLAFGWLIWIPLRNLHQETEVLRQRERLTMLRRRQESLEQERQKFFADAANRKSAGK